MKAAVFWQFGVVAHDQLHGEGCEVFALEPHHVSEDGVEVRRRCHLRQRRRDGEAYIRFVVRHAPPSSVRR